MPVLDIKNVSIYLGNRLILKNITFSVNNGEFIAVLGPNGAGKTTLMRAILGLIPISIGKINILGNPIKKGNSFIGYMPQTRILRSKPNICVKDFLMIAAEGHRWGLPYFNKKIIFNVDRVLNLVNAKNLEKQPIFELSSGERQRLLLAQCLLGNPSILLLDEPLANLDLKHQRCIVKEICNIQSELNIAVLFCSHEINPLLNVISRVLYLGKKVAVIGKIDEIITSKVLSMLYGTSVEVMRVKNRIFIMSDNIEVEKYAHNHELE